MSVLLDAVIQRSNTEVKTQYELSRRMCHAKRFRKTYRVIQAVIPNLLPIIIVVLARLVTICSIVPGARKPHNYGAQKRWHLKILERSEKNSDLKLHL
jgi:hypothetical protein